MARDTTPTTNRGYDRPALGDDWAASWDELVEDLDANARYGDSPRRLVDDPQRLPAAALDAGDSIEIPIPVADGETLEVYRWGAYNAADYTAPTGLDVELVDGSDVVQTAENTTNTEDATAPVASLQNTTGTLSVYKLRAANDTGSAIGDADADPGVGSHFGFWVV